MISSEPQSLHKERLVLPRWLSYLDAVRSDELSVPNATVGDSISDFTTQYTEFLESNNVRHAADLMGLAFMEGRPEATALAHFVLKSVGLQRPTVDLAQAILGRKPEIAEPLAMHEQIAKLRKELRQFPRNPFKWVDLARYYTSSGKDDKASDAFRVALNLAPEDRFTVRAYSRFIIHQHTVSNPVAELGVGFFRRNKTLLKDPWLLATATSMSALANMPSPLPRKMNLLVQDSTDAFQRSELLEAFGMQELSSGNDRIAKKAFRSAWVNPTSNVVSHAEWVTRFHFKGLRSLEQKNVLRSNEALAFSKFADGDFKSAISYAELWFLEEPYSRRPLILLSFIYSLLEDFSSVASCYLRADSLKLNNPMLKNNYLFSLISNKELNAASELLEKFSETEIKSLGYTFAATLGLYYFLIDEFDQGVAMYQAAEARAKKDSKFMADYVFVHWMIALVRFGYELSSQEIVRLQELMDGKEHRSEMKRLFQTFEQLSIDSTSLAQADAINVHSTSVTVQRKSL
jgi:Tfp pilus assembly protein PilF